MAFTVFESDIQRQSTLDCRYQTLVCDNLKKRMFLQNGMSSIWGLGRFFETA
jgi:hypothetical protein